MLVSLSGAGLSTLLLLVNTPILTLILLVLGTFVPFRLLFRRLWLSGAVIFLSFGIFLGGILTALEGIMHGHFSSPLFLLPIFLVSLSAMSVFLFIQRKLERSLYTISTSAKVTFGEKELQFSLLVDSGNLARESTTGKRVIIVSENAWGKINLPADTPTYTLKIKGATGTAVRVAYLPDKILLDKEYNKEDFLIMPENSCKDFGGYDGIIPIPNTLRRKK